MNYILLGLNLFLLLLIGCSKEAIDHPPQGKILFRIYKKDFWGFPPGVYIMNTDGSGIKRLVEEKKMNSSDLIISPDGNKILLVEDRKEIWIMKSDGSERKRLSKGDSAKFSPDGKRIIFALNDCYYIMNTDGTGIKRWNEPPTLGATELAGASLPGRCYSPDGKKIVSIFKEVHKTKEGGKVEESGLSISNIDGTEERKILLIKEDPSENYYLGPGLDFSPDGKMVAFEIFDVKYEGGRKFYRSNVGIVNIDGTGKRILTNNKYDYYPSFLSPTFTPDSKRIIYNYAGKLYFVNLDGTENKILARHVSDYSFTPEGRIIFCGRRPFPFFMKNGIYVVKVDGSDKRKLGNCPRGRSYSFFWPKEEEEK